MREKKTLLILLAMLVVLLAVFFGLKNYNSRQDEKQAEKEQESEINITEMGDLKTITFSDGTAETTLEKKKDAWKLADDPDAKLNETIVSTLESEMKNLAVERRLEDPDELADYGLENPAFWVRAQDTDGKECTVYVGDSAGDAYYLTVDDKKEVYTGGSALADALQQAKDSGIVSEDTGEEETSEK